MDMSDHESFEDRLRSIAKEISRSVERMSKLDIDGVAESFGVDAARAREFADAAGQWLSAQIEGEGAPAFFQEKQAAPERTDTGTPAGNRPGPHPLDMPTDPQGLALSALDSGRWTVGPGSNVLAGTAEGPGPTDAAELVGDLRARDWITAGGELTLVGRRALARWYDSAVGQGPDSAVRDLESPDSDASVDDQ
jgi:hypothetical protein